MGAGPIQTLGEARRWAIRRAGLIALVTLLVIVAGVLLALSTERVYRAAAVIQVTNPMIESNAASDPNTVTRRVQAIEQQLMSRDSMLALGERHGIFDGLSLSPTERLVMMRESVRIEAVSAAQAGFSRDGSLSALIVSAAARSPQAAADLANDLADDVVRENATQRRDRAQSTLRFYQAEEARVEALITELEAEITAFQMRHEEFMPGTLVLRREELGRLTESQLEIERELAQARGELAAMDGSSARALTARRVVQLNEMIARRTDEIMALGRRIDAIQAMFQRGAELELEMNSMNRRMTQLQTQLTSVVERRRSAEIGARLEGDDQSERFLLLEAALPPDHPVSRSRRTIVALAAAAGVMAGLALAYLVEWMNPVLRTTSMFEREVQLRPVISLPYQLPRRERRRRGAIWGLGLGFLVLAMLALAMGLGLL